MQATMQELKATFTEWDRRYREEPERFMSEAQHLLKETPETYGDECGPYFDMILREIQAGVCLSTGASSHPPRDPLSN